MAAATTAAAATAATRRTSSASTTPSAGERERERERSLVQARAEALAHARKPDPYAAHHAWRPPKPGHLSAKDVCGCYVGSCWCPLILTAFMICAEHDDDLGACGGARPAWKSLNLRNDALTCQVPCTAASHGVGTRLCPALDRGSSLGQSMVYAIWRLRLELFVAFHQFPRLGTFTGMAVASGSLKSLKVVQKGCTWEAGARSAGAAFLVACLPGAGFLVDVQG